MYIKHTYLDAQIHINSRKQICVRDGTLDKTKSVHHTLRHPDLPAIQLSTLIFFFRLLFATIIELFPK